MMRSSHFIFDKYAGVNTTAPDYYRPFEDLSRWIEGDGHFIAFKCDDPTVFLVN